MGAVRMLAVAALAIGAAAGDVAAADWPQWRGPNRDGVAHDLSLPQTWPDSLTLLWRREVGEGHASPIIAGGRVFVHSRSADQEVLSCFHLATGELIWRDAIDAPYEMNSAALGHGKGPKATPATDGQRVVTLGITGILSCVSADGSLQWRRQFWDDYPNRAPLYGTASSPLIDGGLVYAQVGGDGAGALVAVDLSDGSVRWRWEEDGPGYTSPVIFEMAGTRLIATQSQGYCVAVDAASGRTAWKFPYTTAWDQNIVTPVVSGGDAIIFSGLDKGTTAYRFESDGGSWSTSRIWHNSDVAMYMSSPVLADGLLFGMAKARQGQFFCLDAGTGETLWTSPGREGDNAALIDAGPVLMLLTTDAELKIIDKSAAGLEQLAQYRVADTPTWAHPAVAGIGGDMGIVIKDATALTVWSTPGREGADK